MLRLIVLPILPLLVLCAGALGLVAAAPSAPDPLIEQLLHDGCEGVSQPCWYGIIPGITGFQEAIDRLGQHPWIGKIDVSEMPSPYVSWLWSSDAPAAIRGEGVSAGGYVWVGYPDYHHVEGIHVWTALPQGAYWLALGRPDEAGDAVGSVDYSAGHPSQGGNSRLLASTFQGGTLVLQSGFPCEATVRQFFSASAAISVYTRTPRMMDDLTSGGLREWLVQAPCGG